MLAPDASARTAASAKEVTRHVVKEGYLGQQRLVSFNPNNLEHNHVLFAKIIQHGYSIAHSELALL
jgi:hypothetical protein